MNRLIEQDLIAWKQRPGRMPLIVRGARQVGKTFVIEKFAKEHFSQHISINFELHPELNACFDSLDPQKILEEIHLLTGQKLSQDQDLLFLDEIQECPQAIQALRYFKELMPCLSVIAAGSLLEFALSDSAFRMPVGRVEFLYLQPLSFLEFLRATQHEQLCDYLNKMTWPFDIPDAVHIKLLELVKRYFIIGGMPGIINTYVENNDIARCQQLQAFLLNTFRNDFGKYASLIQQKYCRTLFNKLPFLVAKQFKYVDVDPDIQSRELKIGLKLLRQAGVLSQVYASQANGLPLNASINEKAFKLLFLDIGLTQYSTKLGSDIFLQDNLLLLPRGRLAEQFVGQELLAHQPSYDEPEIFFWKNDKRGSQAEIDYLINIGADIIPIEVKAGKSGRTRSLHQFMTLKKCNTGIKVSMDKLNWDGKILSLPLYLLSQLTKILSQLA